MIIRVFSIWLAATTLSLCSLAVAEPSEAARAAFKNPAREYSNAPLWVWNDLLTETQIRESLCALASNHVKQVFVHPRPGLATPYLSDRWFHLWRVALQEAEKLDMNVWIYDENSYPSGFAGGLVPDAMPESRGCGISFAESRKCPSWDTNTVAIYALNLPSTNNLGTDSTAPFEDISLRVKGGESFPENRYFHVYKRWAEAKPWHGGKYYVNLLSPGVTEKFIQLTFGSYKRELGEHFGKRIPGIFTDEPNIRPIRESLPWSETIPAEFKKRWGYDLIDHLPSLHMSIGDYRRIRHNYFQVLHEQFVEHWAKPNFEFCRANNLEWTGHYWDHDWPECVGVPDNMGMYAWHQRPAIDCLMNQYREATDAQFGNVRMARELASVANQLGARRTLCEAYGAGGWDLRFEDMKRIGDWLYVLGVNTLDEHLAFISIRGARKRDHPQSFSYHEPWWEAYHLNARYFAHLSGALSHGQQINRILILEPTTTAWMYQENPARLKEIGNSFFDLLMALEAEQIEYDLVSEDILARFGKPGKLTDGSKKPQAIRVGEREYETLLIPPFTENLNRETKLLLDHTEPRLVIAGEMPARIDGALNGANDVNLNWIQANTKEWIKSTVRRLSEEKSQAPVFVDRAKGDKGILFHMRKEFADGQMLFLVNTSLEHSSRAEVFSSLPGAEAWDLVTGEIRDYPIIQLPTRVCARVVLPPSGSLLLFFKRDASTVSDKPGTLARSIPTKGKLATRLLAENVLTLDYVSVTVGGESLTNVYFQKAAELVWKKHGFEKNPWESAVQFRDDLISRTFDTNSGFEATYTFVVKSGTRFPRLAMVVEHPEMYSITFNGTQVFPDGRWWLDKSFSRIELARLVKPGENRLRLRANPMTIMHELEPAYVVGDFGLEPSISGFVITKPLDIRLGRSTPRNRHTTDPDGTMWLSAGVDFKPEVADRTPWLLFDLSSSTNISAIKIWNYNEAQSRDFTSRGAKLIRIRTSNSEEFQDNVLGEFTLIRGDNYGLPQILPVDVRSARFVRIEFLANHAGIAYPFVGNGGQKENDNGLVGLAEVEFLDSKGNVIPDVHIANCSSELSSHNRLASFIVNGSGLEEGYEGWNAQGYPFYSHAVAYSQNFEVTRLSGRYAVALPSWKGSVAMVKVNGKEAGWIISPPFECDVTRHIKRGSNKIEVSVFGTLKNTLGPHHGNPALGTAWPSKFKNAPEQGPPPGRSYSTVGYGLFEKILLKNLVSDSR